MPTARSERQSHIFLSAPRPKSAFIHGSRLDLIARGGTMGFRSLFSRRKESSKNGSTAASGVSGPEPAKESTGIDGIELSELSLDPAYHGLFRLGADLAAMNAQGATVPLLTKAGVMHDYETGRFQVRGVEPLAPGVGLVPAVARQLESARLDFGPEPYRAILAGYLQGAYFEIEPLAPGFVRELLPAIGVNEVASVPAPREAVLAMLEELDAAGISIVFTETALTIATGAAAHATQPREGTELMLAALLLAGADPVEVATARARLGGGHSADPEATTSDDEPFGRAVDAARRYVRLLLDETPAGRGEALPHAWAFEQLKPFLRALDATAHEVLVDAMSDGLDTLASMADDQGDIAMSMHLAQLSSIILQRLALAGETMEGRVNRIYRNHRGLKWSRGLDFETAPIGEIAVYITYVNSIATLESIAFAKSYEAFSAGATRSLFWSAGERAHRRMRTITTVAFGVGLERQLDEHALSAMSSLAGLVISRYVETLQAFVTISMKIIQGDINDITAQMWLNDGSGKQRAFVVWREWEQVPALLMALDEHGLKSAETARAFEALYETILSA
jgi:hypothetical protein